ncbi:MAG: NUDIX domain-containing protein [Nitrospiraceae bacterium]|nr:NUDIX domain-containing protein [Nitrospiraceae bacterium]
MSDSDEILEVVDKEGNVIGQARRSVLHSDPELIHRVVHVLVFDSQSRLLLQKRSMSKDTAPGKWDTSVGGHVAPGEAVLRAALREMQEELGITGCEPGFLYTYLCANSRESELVSTFSCVHEGEISFNPKEIDAVEFWDLDRVLSQLGSGIFSGQFESEIQHYLARGR